MGFVPPSCGHSWQGCNHPSSLITQQKGSSTSLWWELRHPQGLGRSLSGGAGVGSTKTSHFMLSQHVLMLPCLIPMVLSSKPCPAVSHSCEPTEMEYPVQSLRKVSPLVSRIHSHPWEKVLGSSNEQNTSPPQPKMSHSEETRCLLASTNSSSRGTQPRHTPATTDAPVVAPTFACLSFKPVLNKGQAFSFFCQASITETFNLCYRNQFK